MPAYSAYQFGYQAGFQVVYSSGKVRLAPNGGGPMHSRHRSKYTPRTYELRAEARRLAELKLLAEQQEANEQLKANELRLQELELKRLRDLADQQLQLELMALLQEQQQLQALLQALLLRQEQMRIEEEDLLILMMSMPFA